MVETQKTETKTRRPSFEEWPLVSQIICSKGWATVDVLKAHRAQHSCKYSNLDEKKKERKKNSKKNKETYMWTLSFVWSDNKEGFFFLKSCLVELVRE